jgi:hypothetical protein
MNVKEYIEALIRQLKEAGAVGTVRVHLMLEADGRISGNPTAPVHVDLEVAL